MPLLIDGHNLIGQMRDLSLSDPDDEGKLVARLQRYAAASRKRITVIFDPGADSAPSRWRETRQHGDVRVVFAHAGEKADDVIRARIGEERDKQGLILVTSDAAIVAFARACGLRNISSSSAFLRQMDEALRPRPSGEKPSAHREYENWADVFTEPPPAPTPAARPAPPPPPPKLSKSERLRQQLAHTRPLPPSLPSSRTVESDGELKIDRRKKSK